MTNRLAATLLLIPAVAIAQTSAVPDGPSRLLREPTISATQIAFEYGADLWVVSRDGGEARRLTSTPAIGVTRTSRPTESALRSLRIVRA